MAFAGALISNKLLKAETLAEATRAQFTTGACGFGFQLGRPDEPRTYATAAALRESTRFVACIRSR